VLPRVAHRAHAAAALPLPPLHRYPNPPRLCRRELVAVVVLARQLVRVRCSGVVSQVGIVIVVDTIVVIVVIVVVVVLWLGEGWGLA
tara:strand:- start:114 stop:374 length:261 start_codon:yes stop_codon:yes gene_type:complete